MTRPARGPEVTPNGSPGRMERLRRALLNSEHRFVVTSADLCHDLARVCAAEVVPARGVRSVTRALSDFAVDLLAIPAVRAAAFLAYQEGRAPTTVAIDVLMPLSPVTAAGVEAIDAVMKADGRLADRLGLVLPTSLRFVDTAGANLELASCQVCNWVRGPRGRRRAVGRVGGSAEPSTLSPAAPLARRRLREGRGQRGAELGQGLGAEVAPAHLPLVMLFR